MADFNLQQDLREKGNGNGALEQIQSTRQQYNAELTTEELADQLRDQAKAASGDSSFELEPEEETYANGFDDEQFVQGFIQANKERREKKKRQREAEAKKAKKPRKK